MTGGAGFSRQGTTSFKNNKNLRKGANYDTTRFHEKSRKPLLYPKMSKEELIQLRFRLKEKHLKKNIIRFTITLLILIGLILYWIN